jgi:cell shape-determining protein MreC
MKRPKIKTYFETGTNLQDIIKIYNNNPELFNYVKDLDNYSDFIEEENKRLKNALNFQRIKNIIMNTTTIFREMTTDEVSIFIMINDAQKEKVKELFNELAKQGGGWVLKVIEKRFKAYSIKVDDKIMIMILAIGNGVVGMCANYVDDIVHWCKENSKSEINFKIFTEKIYPHGFPAF